MNIPTEYYEEELIEFEKYLEVIGEKVVTTADNIHANSDYYLERFRKFEKLQKAKNVDEFCCTNSNVIKAGVSMQKRRKKHLLPLSKEFTKAKRKNAEHKASTETRATLHNCPQDLEQSVKHYCLFFHSMSKCTHYS